MAKFLVALHKLFQWEGVVSQMIQVMGSPKRVETQQSLCDKVGSVHVVHALVSSKEVHEDFKESLKMGWKRVLTIKEPKKDFLPNAEEVEDFELNLVLASCNVFCRSGCYRDGIHDYESSWNWLIMAPLIASVCVDLVSSKGKRSQYLKLIAAFTESGCFRDMVSSDGASKYYAGNNSEADVPWLFLECTTVLRAHRQESERLATTNPDSKEEREFLIAEFSLWRWTLSFVPDMEWGQLDLDHENYDAELHHNYEAQARDLLPLLVGFLGRVFLCSWTDDSEQWHKICEEVLSEKSFDYQTRWNSIEALVALGDSPLSTVLEAAPSTGSIAVASACLLLSLAKDGNPNLVANLRDWGGNLSTLTAVEQLFLTGALLSVSNLCNSPQPWLGEPNVFALDWTLTVLCNTSEPKIRSALVGVVGKVSAQVLRTIPEPGLRVSEYAQQALGVMRCESHISLGESTCKLLPIWEPERRERLDAILKALTSAASDDDPATLGDWAPGALCLQMFIQVLGPTLPHPQRADLLQKLVVSPPQEAQQRADPKGELTLLRASTIEMLCTQGMEHPDPEVLKFLLDQIQPHLSHPEAVLLPFGTIFMPHNADLTPAQLLLQAKSATFRARLTSVSHLLSHLGEKERSRAKWQESVEQLIKCCYRAATCVQLAPEDKAFARHKSKEIGAPASDQNFALKCVLSCIAVLVPKYLEITQRNGDLLHSLVRLVSTTHNSSRLDTATKGGIFPLLTSLASCPREVFAFSAEEVHLYVGRLLQLRDDRTIDRDYPCVHPALIMEQYEISCFCGGGPTPWSGQNELRAKCEVESIAAVLCAAPTLSIDPLFFADCVKLAEASAQLAAKGTAFVENAVGDSIASLAVGLAHAIPGARMRWIKEVILVALENQGAGNTTGEPLYRPDLWFAWPAGVKAVKHFFECLSAQEAMELLRFILDPNPDKNDCSVVPEKGNGETFSPSQQLVLALISLSLDRATLQVGTVQNNLLLRSAFQKLAVADDGSDSSWKFDETLYATEAQADMDDGREVLPLTQEQHAQVQEGRRTATALINEKNQEAAAHLDRLILRGSSSRRNEENEDRVGMKRKENKEESEEAPPLKRRRMKKDPDETPVKRPRLEKEGPPKTVTPRKKSVGELKKKPAAPKPAAPKKKKPVSPKKKKPAAPKKKPAAPKKKKPVAPKNKPAAAKKKSAAPKKKKM